MSELKHAQLHHCYGQFLYGSTYGERECFTCKQISDCMTNTNYKNSYKHVDKTLAVSDGSTAEYYTLPAGATQLQDLISHRDMNAQVGEIFRACYRYGQVAHSPKLRDMKKIAFYAQAEIARLEKLEASKDAGTTREKSSGIETAKPATNNDDHTDI